MNNRESEPETDNEQEPRGPNLVLIYSLLGIGFVLAILVALLIVAPFYLHRR